MNKTNLLTKLLLLCLCVVGSVNAWGAVTYSGETPKTKSHLVGEATQTFLDVANTTSNASIDESTKTFAIDMNYLCRTWKPAWISGTYSPSNSAGQTATGFLPTASSSSYDAYTESYGYNKVKNSAYVTFYVTGITGVAIINKDATSGSKYVQIKISEIDNDGKEGEESVTSSNNTEVHVTEYAASTLLGNKFYKVVIYGVGTTGMEVYQIRFTQAAAVPSLTGAWKISSTDVTGETANVVQGSAPTVPTFDVGATSGTPTSDDYRVAYSLKDGSDDGIFTYTSAGGPTAISTANAGSATIVATLTTANASKFLTPATNTFEYTVTVSEASAPEISIDGDASVARGGDLTLTATAEGTPTPTIEWFLCADAEGNSPVSQGEASTSNTTFNVSTAAVGTYYIVAAANNGVGGDANNDVFSDVKTITIVPKAPTLTAGGLFVGDSKSVTIDKADGEDVSATIKYKIGDGEWTAYSETLSIAATSTVYAKVEQDGLTSAEASATYTKFEKSSVTAVSAGKTWNWSNITSSSLELSGSTTPVLNDEFYTYSDIASLNSLDLGTFDGETIAFSGQYPVRNKAFQNGAVKIVTTVPGTISVDFSDTGNKYAGDGEGDYESNPNRYLNVNGVNTEHYVRRTGSGNGKVTDKVVSVPAGEITIKGMRADGETAVAIMVYKIVFTPTPGPSDPVVEGNTVTLTTTSNMAGWRAYYNADNNYSADENTKVYVAASDPEGDVITLTPIAGVPAGVPVILKTSDTSTYTMTLTKEEAGTYTYGGTNKLAVTDGTAINSVYRLGYNSTDGVGFYPYSGTPAAGTVYLNVSSAEARALTIAFDEDGETTAIKAIDNEQLTIDNYYDLQGRKVAQPQKGLYIVNGKKVIVK